MHEEIESNTLIQIYGLQGNPLLLPKKFTERYFVTEVCRQYHDSLAIFERKTTK